MQVLEHYVGDKLITKKFSNSEQTEDYILSRDLTEYTLDGIHIMIIERSTDYASF